MLVYVSADPAKATARFVAARLAAGAAERGGASLAVSGGSTAPVLFDALSSAMAPHARLSTSDWASVGVWQVDERIAPDGDEDRNANQLAALPAQLHPMGVTADDLVASASEYAAGLPERFDVVHLGVGPDGHTASWLPLPHPDAERAVGSAESVFTVGEYQGRSRMTLGPRVVNAARWRVVLATGAAKAAVIARWVEESEMRGGPSPDPDLPIAAVDPDDTMVFLDEAAASVLDRADYALVDDDGFPVGLGVDEHDLWGYVPRP